MWGGHLTENQLFTNEAATWQKKSNNHSQVRYGRNQSLIKEAATWQKITTRTQWLLHLSVTLVSPTSTSCLWCFLGRWIPSSASLSSPSPSEKVVVADSGDWVGPHPENNCAICAFLKDRAIFGPFTCYRWFYLLWGDVVLFPSTFGGQASVGVLPAFCRANTKKAQVPICVNQYCRASSFSASSGSAFWFFKSLHLRLWLLAQQFLVISLKSFIKVC